MAAPLRRALGAGVRALFASAHAYGAPALAIAGVALVFAPLLPGLCWALAPAGSAAVWRALLAAPEWPQALLATLCSTLLSTAAALLLAGAITMQTYPQGAWLRLQRRLTLLLAVPHAAFAVGLFFLLAPSGWLARLLAQLLEWTRPPDWPMVHDEWGLCLALALAIKEAGFLLWALSALLGEQQLGRQMTVARSLGYSRHQAWRQVLWPQLLPRLGWPLAAVFAYGLSVVDMALILGPTTPPTLAVLIWQWLSAADPAQQAQGSAAALALCVLLALSIVGARGLWRLARRAGGPPNGRRRPPSPQACAPSPDGGLQRGVFALLYLIVAALLVWSLAGPWFFPALWPAGISLAAWQGADLAPTLTALWLGVCTCAVALPIALLWLEWGPRRFDALLTLPLIVPALPLAVGQYAALLRVDLDASAVGLVWSHLLWVLPYVVLTLIGPYRSFDARLMTCAQALGRSRWQACLAVKWPLLLRPLLAALAVGFAVSVAQYLPTLFAGGGRYATVTTEAVALSAGGRRDVLAVQALLQLLLPLLAFALAAFVAKRAGKHRRGLR